MGWAGVNLRVYVCEMAWRPRANQDGPNARLSRWASIRHKNQVRDLVASHLRADGWPRDYQGRGVCTITVRASRGPLPDAADNQGAMLKTTIDAIAAFLGVDDSDRSPVRFEVVWERGPDGTTIILEELP